jgi:LmbE family N-acetylglucosaminyl deacetylase
MTLKYINKLYISVKNLFFTGILLTLSLNVLAQGPGQILHEMEKLNVLGTVLYVAAHPDDENTRMISYFSNHHKTRTVYLSLTRGDGGQNLIGPELREELGLIRTHELLKARSVDGGEQCFSRANDFGYSKTPEETMEIWNKEEVLADVVWAIRKYRPDIIINRFSHEHNGRTHGHHTASAMLSYEAFDMAGDSSAFPEQLEYVDVWTPKRLYFNTSWWFYGSQQRFAEEDKSEMAEVNVGVYYPLLGASNNEISAASRSMHKCQGFGSATSRGAYLEYLKYLKGEVPSNKDDVFDGIDLSWARTGTELLVQEEIETMIKEFDPSRPHKSISRLLSIREMVESMDDLHWKRVKLEDIDQLILACSGLFARLTTSSAFIENGGTVEAELEVINRSDYNISLERVSCPSFNIDTTLSAALGPNQPNSWQLSLEPQELDLSSPYWLKSPPTEGMFTVEDQTQRGIPLSQEINVRLELKVYRQTLTLDIPLEHVRVDPVQGELVDPVRVRPEVSLDFAQKVTVFKPNETKRISVEVRSAVDMDSARLLVGFPDNWLVQTETDNLALKAGEANFISLEVTAPGLPESNDLSVALVSGTDTFTNSVTLIKYDHIPQEQIVRDARCQIICVDLRTVGQRIGYVQGAGDEVGKLLNEVGYACEELNLERISAAQLSQFDAVIMGIRAYNTLDAIQDANKILLDYVEAGGNLIVQYNTRHRLKIEDFAPYPLKLSRKRVTDEHSRVSILDEDHPLMTTPNKITLGDFDDWVQERGLYFPEEWSEKYTALLSMNDNGEEPLQGALLVAPHGKGNYIYSPISYFRQLPAGVSGAYRLLANMIALGKNERP